MLMLIKRDHPDRHFFLPFCRAFLLFFFQNKLKYFHYHHKHLVGNSHQWEGFLSHQWDEIKFSPVGKKIHPTGKKKIFPTGENLYEKKFSPVGRKWRKWRKREEWEGRGR